MQLEQDLENLKLFNRHLGKYRNTYFKSFRLSNRHPDLNRRLLERLEIQLTKELVVVDRVIDKYTSGRSYPTKWGRADIYKNLFLDNDVEWKRQFFDLAVKDLAHIISKIELEISSRQTEVAPYQRPYWYENSEFKVRLVDGSVDQLDFSTAPVQRLIFEAFYNAWSKDGLGHYKPNDILEAWEKGASSNAYKRHLFTGNVSAIKGNKLRKKPAIAAVIQWDLGRKDAEEWIFKINVP